MVFIFVAPLTPEGCTTAPSLTQIVGLSLLAANVALPAWHVLSYTER